VKREKADYLKSQLEYVRRYARGLRVERNEARRQLERIASAVVENAKKVARERDWCNFCECHPSSGHRVHCVVRVCEEIVEESGE
jgi:hypothetical protein